MGGGMSPGKSQDSECSIKGGGMSVSQNLQPSACSSMLVPPEESLDDSNHMAVQTVDAKITRQEMQKRKLMSLAVAGMNEFRVMVDHEEPLWRTSSGFGDSIEKLNLKAYYEKFHAGFEPKRPGFNIEGTRATTIVVANPNKLVNMLMDVNKWSRFFSSIISRAVVTEVLSAGEEGDCNGMLQVMTVDYQLPSPMLPISASSVLRYCRKFNNSWAIVDVSVDSIDPNLKKSCHMRLCGCLIKPLSTGPLKITWIEHHEVEMGQLYKYFLDYSMAFGAKRWVEGLDRLFDPHKSVIMCNTIGIAGYTVGAYKLHALSAKVVENYCSGTSGAPADGWIRVPGQFNGVKVTSRRYTEDGRPFGIIINASIFCWLPAAPKTIYDFLTDNTQRFQWDILSNGIEFEEIAHLSCGIRNAKTVSLLRFTDMNPQGNMTPRKLLLQEALLNDTCGYVMYAPFPMELVNSYVRANELVKRAHFVASGVALIPRGHPVLGGRRLPTGDGCMTKVMVQIVEDSGWRSQLQPESINRVQNLVLDTMKKLKNRLLAGRENKSV